MSQTNTTGEGRARPSVSTSVNHPRLVRTDSESIRIFLRFYDHYTREAASRGQQFTTEAVRPVTLKFCVDPETIESTLALDFIEGFSDDDGLTNAALRPYLEKKAEESRDSVKLDTLDSIVRTDLRMDLTDTNARSRMESLFMSYHKILRRNGLTWLLKANQKVTVYHVLSAIKPKGLHGLESDLDFAHHECRKDFPKFMKLSILVSDAFQLLDIGPKHKREESRNSMPKRGGNHDRDKSNPSNPASGNTQKKGGKTARQPPFCPHGPCKAKSARHWVRDCTDSTDKEKEKLLTDIEAAKARDGPSRSTRSKTFDKLSETSAEQPRSAAGRMTKQNVRFVIPEDSDTPPCPVEISDGYAKIFATGRCDDGSDDSLVSPTPAEQAVIRGIAKIRAIEPVQIQVALESGDDAQSFTFSRSSPRTVLQLASGRLALANISFLVADDEFACEDLIIGLPVLRHLQDTRTLLEYNRETGWLGLFPRWKSDYRKPQRNSRRHDVCGAEPRQVRKFG